MMNFNTEKDQVPLPIITAFGIIKKAAAEANREFGLDSDIADAISQAAFEIFDACIEDPFPISMWQIACETETNRKVNEVIYNRTVEILGGNLEGMNLVKLKDHINENQDSIDTFSAAVHIAVAMELEVTLFPALRHLLDALRDKEKVLANVMKKTGMHEQDTTPTSLGLEFGGYATQIEFGIQRLKTCLPKLYCLDIGDAITDTDLYKGCFPEKFIAKLVEITELSFVLCPNASEAFSGNNSMVEVSGALNVIASSLTKIANGILSLDSKLDLPRNISHENEIKNEASLAQCEVLTMVAAKVMGNHVATTIGGSNNHLHMSVFKPMIAFNILRSIRLISDGCISFTNYCIKEIFNSPTHTLSGKNS